MKAMTNIIAEGGGIGNVIDYVIGHIIENLAMIYVIAFDF